MQLDLFMHGRDVMLQNDVIAALRRRDAAGATEAFARLAAEFPEHGSLAPLSVLLAIIAPRQAPPPTGREEIIARVREMDAAIFPAAVRIFGHEEAKHWLSPVWGSLATAVTELPFDPQFEMTHAGFLFLRGADWAAAEASILTIPSWWRMPAPLAWMIEARFHREGLEAVWCLLVELVWMAPQAFRELAPRLPSEPLHKLLNAFDASLGDEDGLDVSWFPAWLLIDVPAMASVIRQTRSGSGKPAERVARSILDLLALEKQGRHAELVAQRRQFRDQHEVLYRYYMSTR
jgi:hypothetical protein